MFSQDRNPVYSWFNQDMFHYTLLQQKCDDTQQIYKI
jgi:hypothetical protein